MTEFFNQTSRPLKILIFNGLLEFTTKNNNGGAQEEPQPFFFLYGTLKFRVALPFPVMLCFVLVLLVPSCMVITSLGNRELVTLHLL